MFSKMPKQTYTQKFRKEWLQEGFCKDWIMEIPGDASNACYRFCNSVFRAKLYDIKEHSAGLQDIFIEEL